MLPAIFIAATVPVAFAFSTKPKPRVQSLSTATAQIVNSMPTSESASTAFVASSAEGGEHVDVQLIDLTARGFEPSEIAREDGKFLLAVNNRSGIDNVMLQLTNERGTPVEGRRFSKTKTWRKPLNLPPGDYLLSVEGHPQWVCRMNISR